MYKLLEVKQLRGFCRLIGKDESFPEKRLVWPCETTMQPCNRNVFQRIMVEFFLQPQNLTTNNLQYIRYSCVATCVLIYICDLSYITKDTHCKDVHN